jgi:hypothetical protein
MSLDKKYNVPEETVKRMIRDGVISCSIDRDYKIFDNCLSVKNANPSLSILEVFSNVAENLGVNEASVMKAYYTIRKKS